MRRRFGRGAVGIALGALTSMLVVGVGWADDKTAPAQTKPDVQMTVVGIEYEGSKIWVPSTIVAHKGDRVKINLVSKIPSEPAQHGFAIDAFKVAEVVNRGEPKSVEFVVDKTGIFPIYCQLHPAHVGGQLVVLDAAR